MSHQISITPHEYKMLMDGYHPEFESDDGRGELLEQGKGSDVIYMKEIIRKSDSKSLWFEYAHNTDGGFNHEEPRDGDFKIDYKKKDTLDPYNELKLNEPAPVAEIKPRTIRDDYADIKDECIEFSIKTPLIPAEELQALYTSYKSMKFLSDLEDEFKKILAVSIKYKVNAESIKSLFDHDVMKSKNWLSKYKDHYNDFFDILTEVIIQGKSFQLTTKEMKKLRKSIG